MRVGIFGAYHPEYHRSGSITTSLSLLFAELPAAERIVVFAQSGASLPSVRLARPPEIVIAWRSDDPAALLGAAARMLWRAHKLDAFLFNIYLTSFGSRGLANAVGLCLPSALAVLARRPVVVYMHNFLETQDVRSLGYTPGWATRAFVTVLQSALLRLTDVVVPLQDQATVLGRRYRVPTTALFLPFMDAAFLSLARRDRGTPEPATETPRSVHVLLFGSWGPQKDLEGALRVLASLRANGREFDVTVGGGPNLGFPEYAELLHRLAIAYGPPGFRFVGSVKDEDLLELFARHEILILPYQAAGGQSGVMNLGTLAGQLVVAYDTPQLRETAALLGTAATFVPKGDPNALGRAIDESLARLRTGGRAAPDYDSGLAEARAAALRLFRMIERSVERAGRRGSNPRPAGAQA
jgi:glycosyltransferase involved in cell wall biosynthesis